MIRVMVVDRIRPVCEIMGAALEGEPDITVVGMATSKDEALAMLTGTGQGEGASEDEDQDGAAVDVDVILVNTSLPDQDALLLTQAIREHDEEMLILIVGLPDKEAVILQYIEAGALGYVLRTDSMVELLHNIRAAVNDRALISPSMAAALMARIADLHTQLSDLGIDPSDYEDLTPREKEILDHIAAGLTNQEIGDRLVIEEGTVKNHVHNILTKLNVHSRQDAATYLSLIEAGQAGETDQPDGVN